MKLHFRNFNSFETRPADSLLISLVTINIALCAL